MVCELIFPKTNPRLNKKIGDDLKRLQNKRSFGPPTPEISWAACHLLASASQQASVCGGG